jgi:hypothetical protein
MHITKFAAKLPPFPTNPSPFIYFSFTLAENEENQHEQEETMEAKTTAVRKITSKNDI